MLTILLLASVVAFLGAAYAIQPQTMVNSNTVAANLRILATRTEPHTFAANSAAAVVELPLGGLVTFNTSTGLWQPWTTGGANGTGIVRGIVWPVPITLKATGGGEVIGSIMTRGEAHFADLVICGDGVGTQTQINTALQTQTPSMRELGFDISGLNLVN